MAQERQTFTTAMRSERSRRQAREGHSPGPFVFAGDGPNRARRLVERCCWIASAPALANIGSGVAARRRHKGYCSRCAMNRAIAGPAMSTIRRRRVCSVITKDRSA